MIGYHVPLPKASEDYPVPCTTHVVTSLCTKSMYSEKHVKGNKILINTV